MNLKNTLLANAVALGMATAATAQTEISWWHGMGGSLGDTVNQIASDFNASQSDYKITPVFKGTYEETLTAGIAAFRAGEQPNIMQVFDAGAATVIGAKGAVVPVQDLFAANDVPFNIEDYIAGVRYFYADEDGKMIGMPFNSSTPILYYNTEALEKAGVTAPKTWEEFESVTAPALKDAGYIALAQSHMPWIFTENFFSRHNIPFATNNNGYGGTDVTINADAPELKAHFEAFKSWIDNGYAGFFGAAWDDNAKPFESGEVAMWLGSSGSFGGLVQKADFDFSATVLPYWEGVTKEPKQTFIGGAALFAMAGKSDAENKATAEFFRFMTSPEVQYMWHKETGYVPITEAAYEMAKADGHYDRFPAAETGIQQLQLPAGEWTKGYRMGFYVQIRDVMNREYTRYLTGETSLDDAFGAIKSEADKLLARFAKTQS
ncbi:sn-glycerol 3-phosphate ABC transporter substrate-binding protein [Amylibacter ulvae]|uniref:sn-glycerol-3-phosphate-binding periplasmic protein UgpB n=1 Tax=Paramylibacter ulvae TaxID=1651968 RepID=A0ABQ3DBP7_9RHOB|nr:extracellular solute-binding protein [Amylibacter ulvae]GHA59788.1 sn-glycerol 3-phosphate ABC transporter substrate-binding protein [Amylibacter ulvae]